MSLLKKWPMTIAVLAACLAVLTLWAPAGGLAGEKSMGQTLYVPVYSNIYNGHTARLTPLAITVSLRNIDPANEIRLLAVDYYDSHGRMVRNYVDKPFALPPMASVRYVVKDSQKTRGAGAKFIVRWESESMTNPLLAQGLMISTASQLGISFVTQGVVVGELGDLL